MNIDERIEALTPSVELIASMHQERMSKMLDILERMAA